MQSVAPGASPHFATDEAVLSKAVVRAARLPGLTQREAAEVLGVSVATASRLFAGNYRVMRECGKEWELARLFVRSI